MLDSVWNYTTAELRWFLFLSFILSFFLSHTQVYTRTQPRTRGLLTVSPSGLIYSTHIFLWSLLYVLSFLCLFAGSLALSGVIGARGYRGLPALRGACFAALVRFSWLPVSHRPARSEKKAKGVCSFRSNKKNWANVSLCRICLICSPFLVKWTFLFHSLSTPARLRALALSTSEASQRMRRCWLSETNKLHWCNVCFSAL